MAGAGFALVVVLAVGIIAGRGGAGGTGGSGPAAAPESTPGTPYPDGPDADVVTGTTPGLVIAGAKLPRGTTLNRHDRSARHGPYTVVVRRIDGSLARRGAVVTFPVGAERPGRSIAIGDVPAVAGDGEITWPIAGAYARVRGDLPRSGLIAIVRATRVTGGRPVVRAPATLTVIAESTVRPHYLREARYGAAEAGEADALSNGLVFTAVARAGGYEDQLYDVHAEPSGTVHGKRAVITPVLGGNGILAWEPRPGLVAYVGYSGAQLDADAIAALHRLAERTRLLDEPQWQATDPPTLNQVNEIG